MAFQTPQFYGFDPSKFPQFRDCQTQAMQFILASGKKRIVCAIPTGGGKSLTYMGAVKIGKLGRTLILTSTKGLQEQLMQDFGKFLSNIQGKNNYECLDQSGLYCDLGPCNFGYDCNLKQAGCLYFDALNIARNSPIVVTNYHYYLSMLKSGVPVDRGLGEFDTVICDEGHELPLILAENLSLTFDVTAFNQVYEYLVEDLGTEIFGWEKWAATILGEVKSDIAHFKATLSTKFSSTLARKIAIRERLQRDLEAIISMANSPQYTYFVEYNTESNKIKFGPVNFHPNWAEWEFFSDFKRAIIVSATVREKTMGMLGFSADQYDFLDMPSIFPIRNSPKIHVRTIALNKNTTDAVLAQHWVGKMDSIIQQRLDRKGIIHTTSYRHAELIKKHSRFAHLMFFPQTRNKADTIARFKKSKSPAILVGPALSTGYDFPGDECSYQIITKVPFPNLGDKFLMEKTKYDKLLIPYMVCQTLVQATGRGTRTETDKCENVIIDDNITQFVQRYKSFFPLWWLESFTVATVIPKPFTLDPA